MVSKRDPALPGELVCNSPASEMDPLDGISSFLGYCEKKRKDRETMEASGSDTTWTRSLSGDFRSTNIWRFGKKKVNISMAVLCIMIQTLRMNWTKMHVLDLG